MRKNLFSLWISRLFIGVVVAWNLQCALVFLVNPSVFTPGFELSGVAGEAAIRGLAILFVMWNVPYLVALWHPQQNWISLVEALTMQIIGVIGESAIYFSIPNEHPVLQASLLRFIIFDAFGAVLLIAAVLISRTKLDTGKNNPVN